MHACVRARASLEFGQQFANDRPMLAQAKFLNVRQSQEFETRSVVQLLALQQRENPVQSVAGQQNAKLIMPSRLGIYKQKAREPVQTLGGAV